MYDDYVPRQDCYRCHWWYREVDNDDAGFGFTEKTFV